MLCVYCILKCYEKLQRRLIAKVRQQNAYYLWCLPAAIVVMCFLASCPRGTSIGVEKPILQSYNPPLLFLVH
jgi:hypothetical protein